MTGETEGSTLCKICPRLKWMVPMYIFEMQPSFYDRYLSTNLIHPMKQASEASSSSGNTFQPKVSLGNKSLLEK